MADERAARQLPREIRVRLVDVPRHLRALEYALEQFEDEDDFAEAARSKDPRQLARVYAVERPFELLDNYNVELARLGLVEAGLRAVDDTATAKSNFSLLADGGVRSSVTGVVVSMSTARASSSEAQL